MDSQKEVNDLFRQEKVEYFIAEWTSGRIDHHRLLIERAASVTHRIEGTGRYQKFLHQNSLETPRKFQRNRKYYVIPPHLAATRLMARRVFSHILHPADETARR